jgi:hypothetical protein
MKWLSSGLLRRVVTASALGSDATWKTEMATTLEWLLPMKTASARGAVLCAQVMLLHTETLNLYLRCTGRIGKKFFNKDFKSHLFLLLTYAPLT